MEKLIVKIISESLKNNIYYYEIGFDNLELKGIISTSGDIEMNDSSLLENTKNQLIIDSGIILYNHLKLQFPDIAKKYEL